MQMIPERLGNLEDDPSGMPHYLDGDVDDLPAQSGRVGIQGYCRGTHVLLEGLVEEEAKEHGVVEGGILGKALEGKLLCTEILHGPVHQFIPSPLVIVPDDALRFHQPREAFGPEPLIDWLASSEVGVEEGVIPCEITQKLLALAHLAAVDEPAKALPGASSVSKLHVLPNRTLVLVSLPALELCGKFLEVFDDSSSTDVANPKALKAVEDLD